jgi:tRNA A37 threonylcarbamoyladenosine biosynthesis protein TsaE
LESFFNGDDKIFILQGYAGSGKTTLIKGIISYLKEKHIDELEKEDK